MLRILVVVERQAGVLVDLAATETQKQQAKRRSNSHGRRRNRRRDELWIPTRMDPVADIAGELYLLLLVATLAGGSLSQ